MRLLLACFTTYATLLYLTASNSLFLSLSLSGVIAVYLLFAKCDACATIPMDKPNADFGNLITVAMKRIVGYRRQYSDVWCSPFSEYNTFHSDIMIDTLVSIQLKTVRLLYSISLTSNPVSFSNSRMAALIFLSQTPFAV